MPSVTDPSALLSPPPAARVYLDSGGSAPLHAMTVAALDAARTQGWADPYRLSSEGRSSRNLLEASRQAIAEEFGARTEEVHFAPSHTAAIHAAIAAVARGRRRVGSRIVRSAVERSAVISAADYASAHADAGSERRGAVVVVGVDHLGHVDEAAMIEEISAPGTALACLQHANGEVGTTQRLGAIHAAARVAGVPLLVDAGSSAAHVTIAPDWDILTAHPADWGGPDGIGILIVRSGVRTSHRTPADPDRWFPGGVSVAAAYGAAVSLQAMQAEREQSSPSRHALIDLLRAGIADRVTDVEVLGAPDERLPHVLTFSCLYVEGEALLTELDREGFAVGSGSACTSITLEPSHVLAAIGALTHGNVRVNLHPGVSAADIERFLAVLPGAVNRVRAAMGVSDL